MELSIQVGNQNDEPIVESGQMVGMKRFDSDHKMWVVLRFAEVSLDAEQQLVDLLTNEFLQQQLDR